MGPCKFGPPLEEILATPLPPAGPRGQMPGFVAVRGPPAIWSDLGPNYHCRPAGGRGGGANAAGVRRADELERLSL